MFAKPSIWFPRLISNLSKTIHAIGDITLGPETIKINLTATPQTSFNINELKDFRIIRNATHHYAVHSTVHVTEREMYPPESHDNWISFIHHDIPYKYEFSITDEEMNARFETIILQLRKSYLDFYYASI